jgi:glycosyltransferase involved in cell wall biosynthesis
MKIAIYHELPSGGAKHALYEMASRLAPDNELVLYSHEGGESFMDLVKIVREVVWLPATQTKRTKPAQILDILTNSSISRYEATQRKLAKNIDAQGFDIVFVHASSFIQSPSVLRFLQTPSVYYSQEVRRVWYEKALRERALGRGLGRMLRSRLAKELAKLDAKNIAAASLVCVNSFHSAEVHKLAYGISPTVLYLGTNTKEYKPKTKKGNTTIAPLHLLVVGAMEPFKNQLVIARAASLVEKVKTGVKLEFVFDRKEAKYYNEVSQYLKENSIDFTFHECIDTKKLVELYATSDFLICAADLEPFGLTPLEAMACGTPTIAMKEGGYRETITDGKTGIFFEARDPETIAAAIERAVNITFDPTTLQERVEKNWNWDTTIIKLRNAFEKVSRGE